MTNQSAKFHPVTHVIFDSDGLLIDSEKYYTEALVETAEKHGKVFTNEIKVAMMGTKPLEGAKVCLDGMGLSDKLTPEEFVSQYESVLKNKVNKIKLLPGVERLIKHLKTNNIPMAIATGAAKSGFDRKTSHLGDLLRTHLNHHVYAGSDAEVKKGKPNPDIFEVAAKRFNPPPKSAKDVLVFEDAINGVNAAHAAGMQVVLIPDPLLYPAMQTRGVNPTLYLKSLEDFRPELFGLPPFPHQ